MHVKKSNSSRRVGVEHVAGSFLDFAPSGDAILLQQVLHDWRDEDCIRILKNCHKALPENGRILIRDHVIDPWRNSGAKTGAALNSDVLMLALYQGRGEREQAQSKSVSWQLLAFPKRPFCICRAWTSLNLSRHEHCSSSDSVGGCF